jgi:hypothetical protein
MPHGPYGSRRIAAPKPCTGFRPLVAFASMPSRRRKTHSKRQRTFRDRIGLHRPTRMGRLHRRRARTFLRLETLTLVAIVGIASVTLGIRHQSPIFAVTVAVVATPLGLIYATREVVVRYRLSSELRSQINLLAKKAVAFAAIGFTIVALQETFVPGVFKSDNAAFLAIAALAGAGAWPHALEAHHVVKRHLEEQRQSTATTRRPQRRISKRKYRTRTFRIPGRQSSGLNSEARL